MSLSFPTFAAALHCDGPATDRAAKMSLYGQFIGDWTMDGTVYLDGGATHKGQGEIHFGWVLQGRAIQDVWIFPGAFFGSTLRVYDPGLDAWHILWSDPVKQYFTRQLGRARGRDIEQNGTNEQGEPIRWSFTEITPDSFRWIGERAPGGGTDYRLQAEFFAERA
jgi:hypothetical protein